MAKKLFLDMEICRKCRQHCEAQCSYIYHPGNEGVLNLLELATFALVCRKCTEKPCITACPQDALDELEDGRLVRYNMRCISCKSCVVACPFGTILPSLVLYADSKCDECVGRCDDDNPPLCTQTCPEGALKWVEIEENPQEHIYKVTDFLFVHCLPWREEEEAKSR